MKEILDELPDAYDPPTWERKTDIVFNHIFASYYDDGGSVYDDTTPAEPRLAAPLTPTSATAVAETPVGSIDLDIGTVTNQVIERIATDATLAERFAAMLQGRNAFFAEPTAKLIAGAETFAVEFKSTARWNLREQCKDKRMEDAVVKTIAGFLNTDGGTLLIGVADDGRAIGLSHDLPHVKPASLDGFVNWLTGHLVRAIGTTPTMRTRARIDLIDGIPVCRIDAARSSAPVTARMSDKPAVFWVRMNNSTRALPEIEVEGYIQERWG